MSIEITNLYDMKLEDYILKVHSAIVVLAEINATGETENLSEEDIHTRRLIVDALSKLGVIELEEPKESGKFAFMTAEEQDIYVKIYNEVKNRKK